ncbi:MAG: amidohydrolase [Bacteroidales bacterium]|nr:MAG: amidohydrolase [Bacteroidales bacterium]
MEELIRLRHELHRNPELSGQERATAKRLRFFLSRYRPDELYSNIAGEGMAAVFNGNEDGPTILFRCDMDALPIEEKNDVKYKSNVPGVSHVCGHDGHMAIVSGLAVKLSEQPIERGKIILLYQPSEENGEGAKNSIERLRELDLIPNYAIALHNLPKHPFGSVIMGKYTFSAASKGLIINLTGRNSHAAYPERGLNPSVAVAEIIQLLNGLKDNVNFKDFVLITLIHVTVGEVAFGTSPGSATIMATLRAFNDDDMALLSSNAVNASTQIANNHGLEITTSFTDDYPASVCNPELTHLMESVCGETNRSVVYLDTPNRWSEDFAHFTACCPSLIFGLGSGENQPDIHSPDYDFPDSIIMDGVELMETIARKLTKKS